MLGTDTSMRRLRPGNQVKDSLAMANALCHFERRVNPGVNPITASVRATYGTAHQVVLLICAFDFLFFSVQVGMNSSLPQFKEKEGLLREVGKA